MPKQSKFENVDLFASLNAVMKQNTGFYQSDLEIDKEIIAKAAAENPAKQAELSQCPLRWLPSHQF